MGWSALLWILLTAHAVQAQLSPGKLAKAHQQLEGLTKCTQCHELGKPVDGARCLACHTTLDARIRAGKGYHAAPEVKGKTCVACHSDHHGRDFAMIHWEKGEKALPHKATGWPLEGRHLEADCRDCHRRELLRPDVARAKDLNPARTFLGLSTECAACHLDVHAGQLGADCGSCHNAREWARTTFDHDQARFRLTGAHRQVECRECHTPGPAPASSKRFTVETDPAKAAPRFKPLPFARCTDCHKDPHEGRLGADCASCHTTTSFRADGASFDHDRTRYPLTGAHRGVDCAACHKGPEVTRRRPPHQDCAPCHTDPHDGQFQRDPRLSCGSCHDTRGFRPSSFGLTRHQESRAPLEGAHQAVGCGDCHKPAVANQPLRFRMEGRGFSGQACAGCHQDPHAAQHEPWVQERGCLTCHDQRSWGVASFDHSRTAFPLAGRHADVACATCHTAETPPRVPLKGLANTCAGCHEDPHRAQFADGPGSPTTCDRCHTPQAWTSTTFSHAQSRFPLDGRHQDLSCSACHKPETDARGPFVRYKPQGIRCEDCHGTPQEVEP
jgi:hypothetical protein